MKNDSRCFKIGNIYGGICVPTYKPNIEEILRTEVKAEILKKKIVTIGDERTLGISLEGQIRRKHKLIIIGDIQYNIKYIATNTEQGIYNIQVTIPFSEYIALPNIITLQTYIQPNVIIEDVYIEKIGERHCYISVVIMYIAEVY